MTIDYTGVKPVPPVIANAVMRAKRAEWDRIVAGLAAEYERLDAAGELTEAAVARLNDQADQAIERMCFEWARSLPRDTLFFLDRVYRESVE